MLHLRQRAVILQPAGEEPLLMGRAFHAGQAGVHVQRVRLRSLPGKVGAELHGCRQLRCLLLQHGLLGLQRLLQGLFPAQYRLDGRQRHIQHAQHTDKFKRADIPGSVIAVVVALPARRGEKSLFFVKADVRGGHAALFGSLFDVHLIHLRTYITPESRLKVKAFAQKTEPPHKNVQAARFFNAKYPSARGISQQTGRTQRRCGKPCTGRSYG